MIVRNLTDDDHAWRDASLSRTWGSSTVARRGELVDAAGLPGLVALLGEVPVGLLTYTRQGDDVEVVTLHAEREGIGTGRALMDGVAEIARRTGARRLWLVTTNDNSRAIRFYQQWGMDLVAYRANGVADSRRVKPTIPMTGYDGIPVRHELEFEVRLDQVEGNG